VNVVLLVVDSLRRDAIGAFTADPATARTPNLDRLVRESLDFERAFAASYPTIPFRTDVMTGRHGTPFNPWKPLRFDAPTLPWTLAGAGYCTQLIHDTPHLVNGGHAFDWPFHGWTFVRGAEVDRPWIDDRPLSWLPSWRRDPGLDSFLGPDENAVLGHTLVTYTRANRGRREPGDWNAARLFAESARFVRENARRENFFLWVDCFDPHEPWDAPPEFVRMHDPGDPDGRIDPRLFDYVWLRQSRGQALGLPPAYERRLRAQYAAKVSHMDRWLGVLLAALDETGLADRTAVVLSADHGTCLGEQGRFSKRRVGHTGWEEGHIPLLVRAPGLAPGTDRRLVQPQDIFATILGLAGAAAPEGTDGIDLLAPARGGAGERGSREVALMGDGPHAWTGDPRDPVVSVFDGDWCLNLAADSEGCRLTRRGTTADEASSQAEAVAILRAAGLAELGRRGLHPEALAWLSSGGRTPLGRLPWDGPAGWSAYWGRLYDRW